ncbi:hypothetical protein DSO57_1007385 [Entomophthora muscae]|uniref:Uncharacterized protein n=1 Tax=Entomophthora muscae TaxID=34485 RepID=A0ACC2TUW6_9FUNG|nr:hypothetical protein DSO57_1007385 [Entomophthora muscae]
MELPVTPKPMPASSPNLPTNHFGKLFGIVSSLVVGIARKNLAQATPGNNGPAAQDWIPEKDGLNGGIIWGILSAIPLVAGNIDKNLY